MDRKEIESSVRKVVDDLKQKIDDMEQAAAASDSTKAVEIKNQAVEVLSRVSRKFSQTATEVRSSNDFNEGVSYVMNKSKELYENTMKKIEELSKKPELVNAFDKVNEKLDKAIEVVDSKVNDIKKSSAYEDAMNDLGSLFDGVKRSVNDFTSKEEVRQKIDYAKKETLELAEKGLAMLKEWLSPKGDDE